MKPTRNKLTCWLSTLVLALMLATVAHAQAPITFQYFYDDLGQLVKVVDSAGTVIEYVYDPVGNLVQIRRGTAPAPGTLAIFNFTPQQGGIGETVTIQGQGFSANALDNIVRFNGTSAGVTSATTTTLVVTVPVGASTGPISVTVGATTAQSTSNFTVIPGPVITSIPVTTATAGQVYTYDVQASEPNAGSVLTFSLSTAPNGMTINATTGLIQWIPRAAQVGDQSVTVRVQDVGGLFATQSFTVTVALPACIPPPSGMVSWWPGDGNANDIVGHNNGTLQGVTFAAGEVGQAFSFNGTGASVSVPDSPSLQLGASDFTIDFWLNTTQTTDGALLWKTSCFGPCQGWAVSKRTFGGVDIQVCHDPGGCQQWRIQTPVNDGQWHFVALTRSGTTLKAYLDGRDDTGVVTNPAAMNPDTTLPLLFGNSTSPVLPYVGGLDEVEIFDRALSASEIQAIYNADGAGKCK